MQDKLNKTKIITGEWIEAYHNNLANWFISGIDKAQTMSEAMKLEDELGENEELNSGKEFLHADIMKAARERIEARLVERKKELSMLPAPRPTRKLGC